MFSDPGNDLSSFGVPNWSCIPRSILGLWVSCSMTSHIKDTHERLQSVADCFTKIPIRNISKQQQMVRILPRTTSRWVGAARSGPPAGFIHKKNLDLDKKLEKHFNTYYIRYQLYKHLGPIGTLGCFICMCAIPQVTCVRITSYLYTYHYSYICSNIYIDIQTYIYIYLHTYIHIYIHRQKIHA